jgi:hypothetical protein
MMAGSVQPAGRAEVVEEKPPLPYRADTVFPHLSLIRQMDVERVLGDCISWRPGP